MSKYGKLLPKYVEQQFQRCSILGQGFKFLLGDVFESLLANASILRSLPMYLLFHNLLKSGNEMQRRASLRKDGVNRKVLKGPRKLMGSIRYVG